MPVFKDEIDHYWEKLSQYPKQSSAAGLKINFGLSWQIVPTTMDEMMSNGSKEQIPRVTEAFLKMKKFDIESLVRAYKGIP